MRWVRTSPVVFFALVYVCDSVSVDAGWYDPTPVGAITLGAVVLIALVWGPKTLAEPRFHALRGR